MPEDQVPTHSGPIGVTGHDTRVALVRVYGVQPVDPWYNSVLLQFADPAGEPFEIRMSGPDAQCLGQALNRAGGGIELG